MRILGDVSLGGTHWYDFIMFFLSTSKQGEYTGAVSSNYNPITTQAITNQAVEALLSLLVLSEVIQIDCRSPKIAGGYPNQIRQYWNLDE